MRVVIQRVKKSSVKVDNKLIANINKNSYIEKVEREMR